MAADCPFHAEPLDSGKRSCRGGLADAALLIGYIHQTVLLYHIAKCA